VHEQQRCAGCISPDINKSPCPVTRPAQLPLPIDSFWHAGLGRAAAPVGYTPVVDLG
jgi:hypothetical protein